MVEPMTHSFGLSTNSFSWNASDCIDGLLPGHLTTTSFFPGRFADVFSPLRSAGLGADARLPSTPYRHDLEELPLFDFIAACEHGKLGKHGN
jgi:hypothetical protein